MQRFQHYFLMLVLSTVYERGARTVEEEIYDFLITFSGEKKESFKRFFNSFFILRFWSEEWSKKMGRRSFELSKEICTLELIIPPTRRIIIFHDLWATKKKMQNFHISIE